MNEKSLPEMRQYWKQLGYELSDLNRLKIIHVAGTKGKGSTCAFIESILLNLSRSKLKVGLYTSPHLIEVRERIRINGQALERRLFSEYFFEVWTKLKSVPEPPSYFRFLTLMAFHTFIREKVDVAIVEVGIGGEFDATNIVEKPQVSVITSLGFDHQAILGQTLPEIAWHKAGIMKPDVPCITTNDNESVLDVLKRRTDELKANRLILAEDFLKDMNISASALKPGIPGDHQKINAALAFVATINWLRLNDIPQELHDLEQGLTKARWAGRSQSICCKNYSGSDVQVYLDGAHTMESISACLNWYEQVKASNASNNSKKSVLVFYMSGRRDPMPILKLVLSKCQFDQIIFPLNKSKIASDYPDLINSNVSDSEEMQARKTLVETLNELSSDAKPLLPDSIEDCLEEIFKNEDVGFVLVTGSLHLVGSVSAALKL